MSILEQPTRLSVSRSILRAERAEMDVVVAGDLCAASAASLDQELQICMLEGARHLRVDVGSLLLCTSHGVDVFERTRERLGSRGTLQLCGARGIVARVFDILQIVHDPAIGWRDN